MTSEQYIVPASKPPDKPHVWRYARGVRASGAAGKVREIEAVDHEAVEWRS